VGGKIFAFTICLTHIFIGATKFGAAQKKFGGHCPRMLPRGYGPALVVTQMTKFYRFWY